MAGEDTAQVLSPREIADKWTAAAQQLPFEASGTISTAATTWATFLTGALGAFSIGGLAFLPSEIGKLEGGQQEGVVTLLFGALATGLVARYLATLAAQVTPVVSYTDGELYRNQTAQRNFEAARRLLQSQQVSTVALALLLFGVLLSLIPADKPYRLVTQQGGAVLCGKLVAGAGGAVYVTSSGAATKLTGVTDMTPVMACPPKP
ncbi:hypothetical protein [Deinococcus aluminii]|uniref:Uncharacterized protein n=1 Tax=Deinococcus aluminii TaxID=1656885 RepID=A0ABP9XG84_9DEIO